MYRLSARLLLLLSLLSVFAPATLAIGARPQHNCCTRKCCKGKPPHTHPSSDPVAQAKLCCQQSCPCSLTASQWTDVAPTAATSGVQPYAYLQRELSLLLSCKVRTAAHSVRGPPAIAIA
jgi:hypothetical protein